MEVIKKLKALNPDYKIILWVQQLKDVDRAGEMIARARDAGISVIDMRDVFAGNTLLWQEHMAAMLKGEYGVACDVGRFLFFSRYGGVNPDTDDEPLLAYGDLIPPHGIYVAREACGDLLAVNAAVVPNHVFMEETANYLKKEHAAPYRKVVERLNYDGLFYQFDLYNSGVSLVDFINDYTIGLLGHNTTTHFLDTYPHKNLFNHKRQLAWLDDTKTTVDFQNDVELAIKQIITCILHDLMREPRCLFLDKYHAVLNKYGIGDVVLKLIIQYFPQTLTNVEYLRVTRTCVDSDLMTKIFQKQSSTFPRLKHNNHYFEQLVLTDFNMIFVNYLYQNKEKFNIDNNFWISLAQKISSAISDYKVNDLRINGAIDLINFLKTNINIHSDLLNWVHLSLHNGNLSLGQMTIIKHFLNDLDINAKDNNGNTLLSLLLKLQIKSTRRKDMNKQSKRFILLIEDLINRGVDLHAIAAQGKSILLLAKEWSYRNGDASLFNRIIANDLTNIMAAKNIEDSIQMLNTIPNEIDKLIMLETIFDLVLNDKNLSDKERNIQLYVLKRKYLEILENQYDEAVRMNMIVFNHHPKSDLECRTEIVQDVQKEFDDLLTNPYLLDQQAEGKDVFSLKEIRKLKLQAFSIYEGQVKGEERTSPPVNGLFLSKHIHKPNILKYDIDNQTEFNTKPINEQFCLDNWFDQDGPILSRQKEKENKDQDVFRDCRLV